MLRATLFIMALFASTVVFADKPPYNQGVLSCGAWSEVATDYKKSSGPEIWQALGWLTGYLSGVQYSNSTRMKVVDLDSVVAYMRDYCEAHPLEDTNSGVERLIEELF